MNGNTSSNKNAGSDCYDIILRYFKTTTDTPDQKEMWKNKAYVKLLSMWKHDKISTQNARNALLLLLNLFEGVPPDIFNSRGHSLEENAQSNKKERIKKILKQELSA